MAVLMKLCSDLIIIPFLQTLSNVQMEIMVAVSTIVLTPLVVSSAAAEMGLHCQQTKGVVMVTNILNRNYYVSGLSVNIAIGISGCISV